MEITTLKNELILYHGSYCRVQSPNLEKCSSYKDFGKGFYLTTSKQQAINFAKLTTKKAVQNQIITPNVNFNGIVSIFKVVNSQNFKSFSFKTADKEWLQCIVAHRKRENFANTIELYKNYDVISGKIANDSTNATIVAYMAETFGPINTEQAENICISLLLPERLNDQFCFRTEKPLQHLQFIESIEL